ncbi:TIGR02530 family flagellar biosynthesis protein [Defluviitalea phaphyphila]|uniref:TIGR02530 family flagellar biosynthesis protein n=1 Tax=Defluviitalea phaphyphila TaxID=1473580 RepID=UPI000730CECA|nr:TIGR02530 family flagellar biosynthesis protein [Defluviitalea phaphyphila]
MKINNVSPINAFNLNANKVNTNSQFEEILKNKISFNEQIKFSKHATMRLNSRNIQFTDEQIKRLNKGITKAQEKGIKDSLILVDQVALIVNIKSKTVITAMDSNKTEENVFTNIDGAVII